VQLPFRYLFYHGLVIEVFYINVQFETGQTLFGSGLSRLGYPVKFSDPTGHYSVEELQQHFGVESFDELAAIFAEGGEHEGLWGWYDILRAASDGDTVTAWHPASMHPLTGTFERNAEGNIFVNLGGGHLVPEKSFGAYGGYHGGANHEDWGIEYGAYASNASDFAPHMMKPSMSGTQFVSDIGCNTWDCAALSYDAAAIGGNALMSASLAGVLPSGGVTLAGVAGGGGGNDQSDRYSRRSRAYHKQLCEWQCL
jgi:hypothetical protein